MSFLKRLGSKEVLAKADAHFRTSHVTLNQEQNLWWVEWRAECVARKLIAHTQVFRE
jgi:hypothetical protein